MSVILLARKEFVDSIRNRGLWVATVVLAVVGSATVILPNLALDSVNTASLPQYTNTPVANFVSITALVIGYAAIAGERDTGSIKMLLGLPYTRRDVVLGKYIGLSGVMSVAIIFSYLVTVLVGLVIYDSLPVISYALVALLTLLHGVAFIGIALAVSAAAKSRSRAMTLAVAVFVSLEMLWGLLVQGFYFVITLGNLPGGRVPAWYVLLERLSPTRAFSSTSDIFLSAEVARVNIGGAESGSTAAADPTLAERVIGDLPFYLNEWFSLVVLICWIIFPIFIGYYQFKKSDLGW